MANIGPLGKTKNNDDWMNKVAGELRPIEAPAERSWMDEINLVPLPDDNGPDPHAIDYSEEAPKMVRMEVGALDKPEDRLNALRKHYPDAQPYGDSNFIFTDQSGITRLYNHESWVPSLGDIASIAPEIGETIGGAVGGTLGAVGGGTAGSAVPILGTAAGAFGGAMVGAGTGSTAGREITQRGLNYLFGNDDTRTVPEQLVDAGTTFALNAAGEGAGRLLSKGASAAWDAGSNAWNKRIIGQIDDAGEVAKRAADFRKIGIEPSVGMVSGSDRAAKLEHALIPTRKGQVIENLQQDAYRAQNDEFRRIIGSISDTPLSPSEAGEALQTQARAAKDATKSVSEQLYKEAGEKITKPAVVDSTADFLKQIQLERAGFGEFDKMARGAQTEKVQTLTAAILSDAQKNGMTFDRLKEARSYVGQMAADESDKVMKSRLDDLYRSLTSDMENTAKASGDDALQAFEKANSHYRDYKSVDGFGRGSAAENLMKKDSDDIFKWATSKAADGNNRISAVRRTIEKAEGGKDTWNQVVAGMTERLGKNSSDEFDPGTFMRNWNKLDDKAKDALFVGTENAGYRQDLDRLSRVADNWTKYRKNANHSNTQAHRSALDSMDPFNRDNLLVTALGTTAMMASGGTAAGGLAVGAIKGGADAATKGILRARRVKLLTSKETVNWLAGIPQAEMSKGGLKAYVGKLIKIGATTTDNALAAAINEYLRDARIEDEQTK